MDSTFLGILAGLAIELRREEPEGSVRLIHPSPKLQQLVENLGLLRLVTMETDESISRRIEGSASPVAPDSGEESGADQDLILRAHQNLVAADAANGKRFQDVIAFLSAQR